MRNGDGQRETGKEGPVLQLPCCFFFFSFFVLYFTLHAHIHLLSSRLATALLLGLGSFGRIAAAASAVAPSLDLSLQSLNG